MTREKAFAISKDHKMKITHRYFSQDEYIEILPHGRLITEEGYKFSVKEFMSCRVGEDWEVGWAIFDKE